MVRCKTVSVTPGFRYLCGRSARKNGVPGRERRARLGRPRSRARPGRPRCARTYPWHGPPPARPIPGPKGHLVDVGLPRVAGRREGATPEAAPGVDDRCVAGAQHVEIRRRAGGAGQELAERHLEGIGESQRERTLEVVRPDSSATSCSDPSPLVAASSETASLRSGGGGRIDRDRLPQRAIGR